MMISKRAKIKSNNGKPLYTEKIKTDSGYKWVYNEAAISKREKEKHSKIQRLNKSISKIKSSVNKDLASDDVRTQSIAAIIKIIMDTGMRVGNIESSKEEDTYGATTLKVKHLKLSGGKAKFDFPGKKSVHQEQEVTDKKVISVLKELTKGKKPNDFIFEFDGKKILDRAVNRYLESFKISAKDLRAHTANSVMKKVLKKLDWDDALKETASIIGHEPSVLLGSYLDPSLIKKYVKKASSLSCRVKTAGVWDVVTKTVQDIGEDVYEAGQEKAKELGKDILDWGKEKLFGKEKPIAKVRKTQEDIKPNVKLNQDIENAWYTLKPFLPPNTKLTSGLRTTDDQIRIINNYWGISRAYLEHPEVEDPYERVKILKQYGFVIASPGKSPHEKGRSFDLSGANLDDIAKAVEFVSSKSQLGVQLKPLIEHQNNAVHVTIHSSSFKPEAIAKLMSELDSTYAADDYDFEEDYLDDVATALKKSDAPDELKQELMDAFGLNKSAGIEMEILPDQFPKICSCGKSYTEDEFIKTPFKGIVNEDVGPEDASIGCYRTLVDYDLLHRDCSCGSTMAIKIKCMHGEQNSDDGGSDKFLKEQKDPKWDEVLLEKDGVKLTRRQIRDHYIKNKDKIMEEIKGKPVLIYIMTEKNTPVLKRNHNGKQIIIKDATQENSGRPDNLIYWLDRRLISIHRVLGKDTDFGFVDLDLHDFPFNEAEDYAKKIADLIEKEFGAKTTIYKSGGTGIHIEFKLKNSMDIDELREKLKGMLDEFNENYTNISTGIIKGQGMRSDISVLHNLGSLRIPYSLGETEGKIKEPL